MIITPGPQDVMSGAGRKTGKCVVVRSSSYSTSVPAGVTAQLTTLNWRGLSSHITVNCDSDSEHHKLM